MNRKILLILITIWLIIVFIFSNQNIKDSGNLSNIFVNDFLAQKFGRDNIGNLVRKSAHFIIYLIGGIIVYRFFNTFDISTKRKLVYSFIFIILYACSDELHQHFVEGRGARITDVIIDTCGSIIGVILNIIILNKIFRKT